MRINPELSNATWRKSSYSNTDSAECVEVSHDFPGLVPVRDSKNPHGPALVVPAASWTAFITALKADGR